MRHITRRQAMAATAASTVSMIGMHATAQALEDNAPAASPDDAEMKRVIACGLTDAEAACWVAVADAAGKFLDLPEMHPMDAHEVAQAIHIIQHKLLARPTYRTYLDRAKGDG